VERKEALRAAFMAAANSRALLEDAEKMSIDISPLDGETVGGLVAQMERSPPEVLAYLRKLLAP
jgi:hypothetical protein